MKAASEINIDQLNDLFKKCGFNDRKAKETAEHKKLGPLTYSILQKAKLNHGCDMKMGALIYELASILVKTKEPIKMEDFLVNEIMNGHLRKKEQLLVAVKWMNEVESTEKMNRKEYERCCGVGVDVEREEIQIFLMKHLDENRAIIQEQRYAYVPTMMKYVKNDDRLKWADLKSVKEIMDKKVEELLGPKDHRDIIQVNDIVTQDDYSFVTMGDLARLHLPGQNPQIKPELMTKHLAETGGRYVTRFPPEPNGFLHIGHAKAINVNFGMAIAHQGICYLRYDDTNPETEEQQYFESILDTIQWLGFKPNKITYSSDHFQTLYQLAVKLIEKDKGYVCHCTPLQINADRGGDDHHGERRACIHRNRPIKESLEAFEKMKEGQYKSEEAVLRMKMDFENPNPQFWDPVAYRVKFKPHHRTGDLWKIYPTYDFAHCLCDSLENISHSLCTTEFIIARESYYWLCDALEVYKPVQWEYGRLNINGTILSKRKLLLLVQNKLVKSWDDPRLFTLPALRRRGFPPAAINRFVRDVGVTTSLSVIELQMFDHYVRAYLDETVPRIMAILNPLKVIITNLPNNYLKIVQIPNMPKKPDAGYHSVAFTNTLYIDQSDFRLDGKEDPHYKRLAPGTAVGLIGISQPILAQKVIFNPHNEQEILEVHCTFAEHGQYSAKEVGWVQWVALFTDPQQQHPDLISPLGVEIRQYASLFLHDNPQDEKVVPGGFLTDINPNSLSIIPKAYISSGFVNADVESKWQFTRIGYYCVDPDTKISTIQKDVIVGPCQVALDQENVSTTPLKAEVQRLTTKEGWVTNLTVMIIPLN